MKRDEILAMETGRELDALIAEKVMTFRIESPSAEQCTIWDGREVRYFEPSTDISAAWEIAEQYPISTVERVEIFVGNVEVKVTLWEGFDHIAPIEVTAKTVPEAICKAALIAASKEVPV